MKYSLGMLFTLTMRTILPRTREHTNVRAQNTSVIMNDKFCDLFLNGELFLSYHHCRLVKTVENAAAVELRCLLISARFVNISQVSIRIPTTVKNAEYAGKECDQILIC